MIESLLEEITRLPNEEAEEPNSSDQTDSENSIIASLPIIRAIVNRKIISTWHEDSSDIVQGIILRLLKWRKKYSERGDEMSPNEWESFAARTAYNEINRYFTTQKTAVNTSIEEAIPFFIERSAEGQTEVELISLAKLVWQNICCLSLRQKRALLLNSQKLIVYLQKAGVTDEEIIRILEFDRADWGKIKSNLPLKDAQIAKLIQKKNTNGNLESITKSIKKGRHEARKKMGRLMKK